MLLGPVIHAVLGGKGFVLVQPDPYETGRPGNPLPETLEEGPCQLLGGRNRLPRTEPGERLLQILLVQGLDHRRSEQLVQRPQVDAEPRFRVHRPANRHVEPIVVTVGIHAGSERPSIPLLAPLGAPVAMAGAEPDGSDERRFGHGSAFRRRETEDASTRDQYRRRAHAPKAGIEDPPARDAGRVLSESSPSDGPRWSGPEAPEASSLQEPEQDMGRYDDIDPEEVRRETIRVAKLILRLDDDGELLREAPRLQKLLGDLRQRLFAYEVRCAADLGPRDDDAREDDAPRRRREDAEDPLLEESLRVVQEALDRQEQLREELEHRRPSPEEDDDERD